MKTMATSFTISTILLSLSSLASGELQFKTPDLDSCVVLEQYGDITCSGEPIGEIELTTWSETGSTCYHDKSMETPEYSFAVEDQYCDFTDENNVKFFQTVFLDPTCSGSHSEQVFSTDSCTFGLKLKSCTPTICENIESE